MAWFVGIDLNKKYTQISCLGPKMTEPKTLSQTGNDEIFSIPMCICQKKGTDEWLCGFDAAGYASDPDYTGVWDLFDAALANRQIVIDGENLDGRMLFALYLQKLLMIAGARYGFRNIDRIIFTTKNVTLQMLDVIEYISEYMPAPKDRILIKDYKETFYYYALKQSNELKLHEIYLFNYEGDELLLYRLERNEKTTPKVVSVKEVRYDKFAVGPLGIHKKEADKDALFEEVVKDNIKGHIVSTIYLVGDGFDGGWMHRAVPIIVKERHAFIGKNLFSRGACYGCGISEASTEWPYIYLGDSKTQVNILLEVEDRNKSRLVTLISAGENWYETSGCVSVILEEGEEFDIILRAPDGSETRRQTISLSGLKDRENRTTRLEIYARPEAENEIYFKVTDMGFGEIYPSSGKAFEYRITI